MGKENKKDIYDLHEESVIRILMDQYSEEEGRLLIEENKRLKEQHYVEQEIIDFNYLKVKKLIRNDVFKKRTRKVMKYVSIFILCFITGFIILMAGVEAFRVEVLNFIQDLKEDHIEIRLEDEESSKEIDFPAPVYIPEGYYIDFVESSDEADEYLIQYVNNSNEYIFYGMYGQNSNISLDTEDMEYMEYIMINNHKISIIKKDKMFTIFWSGNQYIYVFQGEISRDDIIKMAESLKK